MKHPFWIMYLVATHQYLNNNDKTWSSDFNMLSEGWQCCRPALWRSSNQIRIIMSPSIIVTLTQGNHDTNPAAAFGTSCHNDQTRHSKSLRPDRNVNALRCPWLQTSQMRSHTCANIASQMQRTCQILCGYVLWEYRIRKRRIWPLAPSLHNPAPPRWPQLFWNSLRNF